MPKHHRGDQPSGGPDGDAALSELHEFEAALRGPRYGAAGQAGGLAPSNQLERDIAEIERATAALRKAEPALETWTASWTEGRSVAAGRQPRPVWLLIGLLWLSTALVTAGAVAAIAKLAG